jgi:hypothetical protein
MSAKRRLDEPAYGKEDKTLPSQAAYDDVDVFGHEDDAQIRYKTMSWQASRNNILVQSIPDEHFSIRQFVSLLMIAEIVRFAPTAFSQRHIAEECPAMACFLCLVRSRS